MKRALICLLLLSPFFAFADNVSVDRALSVAKKHFYTSNPARQNTPVLVWDGEPKTGQTSVSSNPAFYVFNSDNSFVIVAGDDAVSPILGYSDDGKFVTENMPAHVAAWFSDLREYINKGRSNHYSATEKTAGEWKQFENGAGKKGTTVKLLETPNWNQGSPYNAQCPNNSVTGCVATAMAEIICYLKYPSSGQGTTPAYTTDTKKYQVSARSIAHAFDYTKMPYSDKSTWTADQKYEVATLMADCGAMVQMDYTTSSSGANSMDVPAALKTYLKIDGGARFEFGRAFSTTEWVNKLKAQLDQNLPLFYSGRTSNDEGHAFVADGYDSDNKIHINFGWSGTDNGFYAYPDFGPYSERYSENHGAIFGIKPDAGGKNTSNLFFYRYPDNAIGMKSSTSTYAVNVPFTITAYGAVMNISEVSFSGLLAIGVVNNEQLSYIIETSKSQCEDLGLNYYIPDADFYCTLTNAIKTGDKLRMFYQVSGSSTWVPVGFEKNSSAFPGEISLDGSTAKIEDLSSFSYNKDEKKITIVSVSGVNLKLKDSSGKILPSKGISISGGRITIDVSDYSPGTYTATLSGLGDPYTFTFTL